MMAEFIQLNHQHGTFEATGTHFIYAVGRGMVPVDEVAVGEHILSLPTWARNSSEYVEQAALVPSQVLSKTTVTKMGMFAKLTYSGRVLVNGVLASSYTMDEVNTYASADLRAKLIRKLGYDGVHNMIHKVAFPLRAFHSIAPLAFRNNPFFAPADTNVKDSGVDGLPMYVHHAGRLVGKALEFILQ